MNDDPVSNILRAAANPGDKGDATLKARAALAGVALCITDDDRGAKLYIVSRWAMTKALHSADEVEAWLRRYVGA